MSANDPLAETQAKMQEYINNNVYLGWLIDPKPQRVEIHSQQESVEVLHAPTTSSEDVLLGFILDMRDVL